MKIKKLIFASLIGGLIGVPLLRAERFSGRVLDPDGQPLPGATLKSGDRLAVTDSLGRFTIDLPDTRAARVEVTALGCTPLSAVIRADRTEKGNTLHLAPDHTALTEIVVTATRTPKALKDLPVTTRVISADEIAKADPTNIQDLLTAELPGLEFGHAMSQETTLNMGGFGGNAILFLVDGERLAGETMDNVDYSRLNLEDVARVEIVKGASSALYGANAVGGVVNLISRESRERWTATLTSRYGNSGRELRNGANLTFNAGPLFSATSAQQWSKDRVQLTDPFDTQSKIQNIFGGNSLNLSQRLVYRPLDRLTLTARGGYFNRWSDRIVYSDRYRDYTAGLRSHWVIDPRRTLELSYGYDRYDKARFERGLLTDKHNYSNRQHTLHALYTHTIGRNGLILGADLLDDYLQSYQFANSGSHRQRSADLLAQFDWNPSDRINLVASARHDYFSATHLNALTGRLASLFRLKPFTLRAGYAGGFRAPSLKELYMNFDMAGIQMIYGNPDLKPERSHNLNLALERNGTIPSGPLRGAYSLTLAANHNYYNSRITTTDFPGDATREPGAVYVNEDGVKVMTIDFTGRYRTAFGLGLTANYVYLHTVGQSIDSQFSQPRPHSATWRLDYEKSFCSDYVLYASLSGRWLSAPFSRFETDGAYQMWRATLRQDLWRGIGVNLIVENLFDYRPTVYYWNSPLTTGRSYLAGFSLKLDEML